MSPHPTRTSSLLWTIFALAGVPWQAASARGHAPAFPEWRPEATGWTTASGAALVRTDGTAEPVRAFDAATFLRIGRLWHTLTPSGASRTNVSWTWPGGAARPQFADDPSERYGSTALRQGWVLGARNWQASSPAGQLAFSYITAESFAFVAEGGTREFDGDPTEISEYAGLENAQVQRWLPPQVIVNGERLNGDTDTYGDAPGSPAMGDGDANFGRVRGVIDPGLVSERMVFTAWRSVLGVDVFQQVHAYSAENDRDYLLYDIHLANTGNVDLDASVERTGILDDFRYAFAFTADVSRMGDTFDGGGDDVVEFADPWPGYTNGDGASKTFALAYDGDNPDHAGPDWGAPGPATPDGVGTGVAPRLWAPAAVMTGWLFAESAPGSGRDDPAQPRSAIWASDDNYSIIGLSGDMGEQYRRVFAGADYDPAFSTATDTTTYRLPVSTDQASMGVSQFRTSVYQTLAYDEVPHGSTLHWILAVAAGGVSDSLSRAIGANVRQRTTDPGVAAPGRMTVAEIALVRSNRDSALKSVDRAYWAVYGIDPEGRWGWPDRPSERDIAFNVPDAPKPPACVWISSVRDGIEVAWTSDSEALPDHDTGTFDFAGYRIYRTANATGGTRTLVAEIAPGTHSWTDEDVIAGAEYFYAVTTFDDGSANWEDPGESLECGPYWAWSGWRDTGVRSQGRAATSAADLDAIRVVPNPYYVHAAQPADAPDDEIMFIRLPATCTVRVYTAAGRPVHVLHHASESNGTLSWDLRTAANRRIATGVYVYTVESAIGTRVGKFIVVQ